MGMKMGKGMRTETWLSHGAWFFIDTMMEQTDRLIFYIRHKSIKRRQTSSISNELDGVSLNRQVNQSPRHSLAVPFSLPLCFLPDLLIMLSFVFFDVITKRAA